MGDAMSLLSLGTALSVENKGRTHRLALCRRVYSIITWHSTSLLILPLHGIINVSQAVKARGTVSLLVCDLISV